MSRVFVTALLVALAVAYPVPGALQPQAAPQALQPQAAFVQQEPGAPEIVDLGAEPNPEAPVDLGASPVDLGAGTPDMPPEMPPEMPAGEPPAPEPEMPVEPSNEMPPEMPVDAPPADAPPAEDANAGLAKPKIEPAPDAPIMHTADWIHAIVLGPDEVPPKLPGAEEEEEDLYGSGYGSGSGSGYGSGSGSTDDEGQSEGGEDEQSEADTLQQLQDTIAAMAAKIDALSSKMGDDSAAA